MSCNLSAGRLVSCKYTLGGIKTIFIGQSYANNAVTNATFAVNGSDPLQIDTMGFANWSSANTNVMTLYRYELRPNLSSMTVNVTANKDNGTTFYTQTLSVTLQKLDAAMNNELKLIGYARPQIFILDTNDNLWMMGATNGCDLTGGTIITGTAMGDMQGYTMEWTADEITPLWMVIKTGGDVNVVDYPFDSLGDADAAIVISPSY